MYVNIIMTYVFDTITGVHYIYMYKYSVGIRTKFIKGLRIFCKVTFIGIFLEHWKLHFL